MDAEIHPLFIYAKSDHPDLTADQRKEVTKDVEEIKECPEEEALRRPLESPRVMRYSGAWKQGSKNHWRMSAERSTSRPVLRCHDPGGREGDPRQTEAVPIGIRQDWEIGESPNR